jgi:serine/threonine protein kinase
MFTSSIGLASEAIYMVDSTYVPHTIVLQVYGLMMRSKDNLGILMEYLPLGSMSTRKLNDLWVQSGQADPFELLEKRNTFVLGLISGLDYLHSNNIVHRDVKPEKVLLHGKRPEPKISGFGLSEVSAVQAFVLGPEAFQKTTLPTKVHSSNELMINCILLHLQQAIDSSQASLHSVVGTILYMAPEFFAGSTEAGKISYKKTVDIYSLAMVIYQVYTEAHTTDFYPNARQVHMLLTQKIQGRKPMMERLNIDLPKSLATLIGRAVDMDPLKRPTLDQLAKALYD